MRNDIAVYFNEYLSLGGIDVLTGSFIGTHSPDKPAQPNHGTTEHILENKTGDQTDNCSQPASHWVVDFAGVAAGYFTTAVPMLSGLEQDEIGKAIAVVENFLRYVLQHDVCPEYVDDVKAALEVCDAAREELPLMRELPTVLPGTFNLAAADLFCGDGTQPWALHGFERPKDVDSKMLFYSAIALLKDSNTSALLDDGTSPMISREVTDSFQLESITHPIADLHSQAASLTIDDKPVQISLLGQAIFTASTIEDDWVHPKLPTSLAKGEELVVYFDDGVLGRLRPGMKMQLTVCELSGVESFWFVKMARRVVPTFYTFLPQAMMKHFKEPRENARPGPSIHDTSVDEKNNAGES
jgi:hypothetical protein